MPVFDVQLVRCWKEYKLVEVEAPTKPEAVAKAKATDDGEGYCDDHVIRRTGGTITKVPGD